MKDAATLVARQFNASNHVWQDRPVKPPPYAPTAEQIHDLYADLLAQVVSREPHPKTGRVYDHALARGLRVGRLTDPDEEEQRFVLQAQTTVEGRVGFRNVAVVDESGNPAEWTPKPKPEPKSTVELRGRVEELETQLADLRAKFGDV